MHSQRSERAALQASIEHLRDTIERGAGLPAGAPASAGGGGGEVVAGSSSYHRPDCRLVEGQRGLTPMSVAAARSRGLEACRICAPAAA